MAIPWDLSSASDCAAEYSRTSAFCPTVKVIAIQCTRSYCAYCTNKIWVSALHGKRILALLARITTTQRNVGVFISTAKKPKYHAQRAALHFAPHEPAAHFSYCLHCLSRNGAHTHLNGWAWDSCHLLTSAVSAPMAYPPCQHRQAANEVFCKAVKSWRVLSTTDVGNVA